VPVQTVLSVLRAVERDSGQVVPALECVSKDGDLRCTRIEILLSANQFVPGEVEYKHNILFFGKYLLFAAQMPTTAMQNIYDSRTIARLPSRNGKRNPFTITSTELIAK
jgi:hypothetical protein